METIFKEPDFNTIQLLFGFILTVLAVIITTVAIGNVDMLSAVVALLLLKDGVPNLIVGAMAIAKKPEKTK